MDSFAKRLALGPGNFVALKLILCWRLEETYCFLHSAVSVVGSIAVSNFVITFLLDLRTPGQK